MNTCPSLWTTAPKFGAAGGPLAVVLTKEGQERAFSVGAQVRRGPGADALEALWAAQGVAFLGTRNGVRLTLTEFGRRFNGLTWGYLRELGYVESSTDERGDRVQLTPAGKAAAWNGVQEMNRLLERCRAAAGAA